MRTTLTIDDSTAKKLKQIARDTGKSYKEVVNATLRRGLSAGRAHGEPKPYRLKSASLGEVAVGYNLDKALALADQLEDEEAARKLALRK